MEIPAPHPELPLQNLRWAPSWASLTSASRCLRPSVCAHWERGRVGKAGIAIKNNTRGYGRKTATVRPVLARNLCICTCIPMIHLKILSGKEYIFLLIRLSVTLNLKGKPHILEEVPTVHRWPHPSLLLKELCSNEPSPSTNRRPSFPSIFNTIYSHVCNILAWGGAGFVGEVPFEKLLETVFISSKTYFSSKSRLQNNTKRLYN